MNENESYVFNVEQPTNWSIKPDQFWITGWFVSKNGIAYTDVRAFIDEVPHSGILGLPRPDIEAAYPQWTHGTHPGFSFRLDPWVGAKLIRLEILNENNDWAEFWRVPIRVKGEGPCKRVYPRLRPELVKPMLFELIKRPTLQAHIPQKALAARLVQERSTIPLETLPVPPLYGVFENPELIAHTQYNKVHIRGWVFHAEKRVKRLVATTDGIAENSLVYGLEREDVSQLFPDKPLAKAPGFKGIIDLSATAVDPVCLRIFAILEDGTKELCFTKRLYQWSSGEKEHAMPPYDREVYKSIIRDIRQAAREQKVRLGGLSFWKTVLEVHGLYQRESREKVPWFAWQKNLPYDFWLAHNGVSARLRAQFEQSAATLATRPDAPAFTLVVDTLAATPAQIARFSDSVRAQIYQNWRLVFVQHHGAAFELVQALAPLPATDARISVRIGEPGAPRAISLNATIAALTAANALPPAAWLAFPRPDARLAPHALLLVAESAVTDAALELIYTDEDRMDDAGKRSDPQMKVDWSPELVFSGTHPGNFLAIRAPLFNRTGGFASDYDHVLPYDLSLRLAEKVAASAVAHVPFICYHAAANPKPLEPGSPELVQIANSLNASLQQRRKVSASAFQPGFAIRAGLPLHQVYWDETFLAKNPVTIVIPTRDRTDLLERCVEALILTVDWRYVKLLIVDDFTRDEKTLRFLKLLQQRTDFSCRVVRPDCDPSLPFNYSRLMNTALPYVDTPLILHLNNDVDALKRGWVEEMAGWFAIPEVGAVGAKLIYPNDHINHAGIIVGPQNGLADVPLVNLGTHDNAFYPLHKVARNVTAVIGACMMTRTSLYREFDGFNETDFGVTYNDVDYCMRLNAAGHRVVYTPQATLWHWGSASRGTTYYEQEHIRFVRKYPGYIDRFWSRKLVMEPPGVTFDYYRYDYTKRAGKLRLLLVTHNLNFEGAPLFLLEYAAFMVRTAGFGVELISAEEGPLRSAYEALGIKITLVDRHPLHGARHDAELAEQVQVMLAKLDLSAIDVVLCNTAACWWGVHLAAAAGKPSMLYIHESATIKRFFSTMLHKHMHHVARQAFRQATRVCFLCHSSRAFFEELNDYDNFRFVSSWIDLPRIEAFKRAHSKESLRRKYNYGDDETIIANIGTVCERKGQHTFIRTIDYFMRHFAGGRKYRFLFVGGRAGEYQDSLIRDMELLGITNVDIITETRDAYDFFRLSDLFVCTSFEEAFPRVLLESMAFDVPIVTTHVNGVTEMTVDRAEAYHVEPGNPVRFAKVMKTCLDKLINGTSTAPMGYSKVVRAYDIDRVLPKHADMARETFLDFDGNLNRREPRRLSGEGDRVESSW